jgi:hypothetical protein
VPLVAGIVLAGVFLALALTLSRNRSDSLVASAPLSREEVAELLAIKGEAETLAISNKLAEAHAKYRDLFARAQGREIKDPAFWDLLERAKIDQDRVYVILLAQNDPARILTPPLPSELATGPTTAAAAVPTPPATTQSFVDAHPPYAATTRAANGPASVDMTSRVAANIKPASAPASAPTPVAVLTDPIHFAYATAPPDSPYFSDAVIGQSLNQANEFLIAQFKDGEIGLGAEVSETYRQGLNALCVYALLNSGQATHDSRLAPTGPFMRQALDRMKLHPLGTDTSKAQQPIVYARSLRAAALAMANRPEDRDLLKDDVQWLAGAHVDGGYSYDDRFTVRVAPTDSRGVGRASRNNPPLTPPTGPNATPLPKSLGPTKGEQPGGPPAPPAPPAGANPQGGASSSSGNTAVSSVERFPTSEIFASEPPLDLQLADGMHDPRTGAELGPPRRPPATYPPGQVPPRYPPRRDIPPMYPPQQLPEKHEGPFIWDNSNSQYGLMGVWAGAEVGIEVPDAYWAAAQQHWLATQLPNAQWPYRKDQPVGRLAMTAAGIASLLVTHDYLEAPSVAKVGRQPSPATDALAKALAWLEKGANSVDVGGPRTVYLGYTLHALSRVGLASGYKYFGDHDWYRELSHKVVLSQWETGAWGRRPDASADTLIDTAYSVLFLARGRHPILMNKLRLDSAGKNERGEWNNRPRDLANLARFTSRELERAVNWQTVSLDRNPEDWSDAPILYFASHAALKFSESDLAKLRAFTEAGGMLYTQADNGADSFNVYVNALAKQLFPNAELKDLAPDDPIYTLQYVIPKAGRPRLRGLSNGTRLVWIHSPADLAVHWQQRAEKTQRSAFEMGVNLFVYAAGKTDLRNRLEDRTIPAPTFAPSSTIQLARLKYNGNWDPEPAAWPRFGRYLQWETSVTVSPTPTDLAALRAGQSPLAHLAGTSAYTPTEQELTALREYVNAGGTLIAEAMGAQDAPFADSLQGTILPRAFPGAKFEPLPPTHPMLHATVRGTEDVWPPRLRPPAVQKFADNPPPIRMATFGKGRVIYLPLDATSGLLGANTWSVFGYAAVEAQALMKNVILYLVENPTTP